MLLKAFYLLNAFAGLADPPAELPEGGCGLFNWKSWMKYPETHSLEVTLQKGGRGFSGFKVFEIFFILSSYQFSRKGKFEVFVITWRFPKGG